MSFAFPYAIIRRKKEYRMKALIIGLVVSAYVIPFAYMLIADLADIYKRITEVFALKLKPALVVLVRSMIE
jgi:hypothetical protein